MSACPECQHINLPGSLFCINCGVSLLELGGAPAVSDEVSIGKQPELLGQASSELQGKSKLIIMIPASSRHLTFPIGQVVRVGRSIDDEYNSPELNLHQDEGVRLGVSRDHARIQMDLKGEHLVLIDMHSTNGTMLNHFRIPPDLPYPIKSGDEIHFGNLLVHIFLK